MSFLFFSVFLCPLPISFLMHLPPFRCALIPHRPDLLLSSCHSSRIPHSPSFCFISPLILPRWTPYFCLILHLGLFICLCACLPASLCLSFWFSVLLVFMAAPSLSSHFLPQIAAAEQQPDSGAAAAAVAASASSTTANPSWKLHVGVTTTTAVPTVSTAPAATAAVDSCGFRHQTRARSAPNAYFVLKSHLKLPNT